MEAHGAAAERARIRQLVLDEAAKYRRRGEAISETTDEAEGRRDRQISRMNALLDFAALLEDR